MDFNKLQDPEFQAKLRAAKTPEELLELARAQGLELSDEQLQAVAGGIEWFCSDKTCSGFRGCPQDF